MVRCDDRAFVAGNALAQQTANAEVFLRLNLLPGRDRCFVQQALRASGTEDDFHLAAGASRASSLQNRLPRCFAGEVFWRRKWVREKLDGHAATTAGAAAGPSFGLGFAMQPTLNRRPRLESSATSRPRRRSRSGAGSSP